MGPRSRLTVKMVAEVLMVPAGVVRRAITSGALRARWLQGKLTVTLQDAQEWWNREQDRFDQAAGDAALRDAKATGQRAIPWATARKQL